MRGKMPVKARERIMTQEELVSETKRIRSLKYSVCIITNNSEKTIRRTMESLMPLLKAVPGEIIVTDTGCTDATMDIVHEYTKKTNYFEWCNDFSAARNAGLAIADGEWFILIDSDEWFDDTTELIHFFQSGECDQYNVAYYIQRNYLELTGERYSDFPYRRSMARNVQGLHFKGLIHEQLSVAFEPTKYFSCFVHHYGYVKDSSEKAQSRNIPLLERQLEMQPNNHHMMLQLVNEYLIINDYASAIQWGERCMNTPKTTLRTCPEIAIDSYLLACGKGKQYEKGLNAANNFLNNWDLAIGLKLTVAYWAVLHAVELKRPEDVIQYANFYYDYNTEWENCKNGKYMPWEYPTDNVYLRGYYNVLSNLCTAYAEVGDYSKIRECLDKIDSNLEHEMAPDLFFSLFKLISKTCSGELLCTLYEKIYVFPDLEKLFRETMALVREQTPEQYSLIQEALAYMELQTPYTMNFRLIFADKREDKSTVSACVNWFYENSIPCVGENRLILIAAMKYNLDVWRLVARLDIEDWTSFLSEIFAEENVGNRKIVLEYGNSHSLDENDFKQMYLNCMMKETFCLNGDYDTKEEIVASLLAYADALAPFAHRLYRDEMFEPDSLQYLPRIYRFAHHMELAKQQKAEGNYTEYLNSLKNAMEAYPVVTRQVKVLIDSFEDEQLAENRHAQEFFTLAAQVKQQIEMLLTQKKAAEARALIDELSSMLPNDEDLTKYRLMAGKIEIETLTQNLKQ